MGPEELPRIVQNAQPKIVCDFQIEKDKLVIANQPDIVVVDMQGKTAAVIDVAIPSDGSIRKKEMRKAQEIPRAESEFE